MEIHLKKCSKPPTRKPYIPWFMFTLRSLSQRNLSLQSLPQGERSPTRGVTSKKDTEQDLAMTKWGVPSGKLT